MRISIKILLDAFTSNQLFQKRKVNEGKKKNFKCPPISTSNGALNYRLCFHFYAIIQSIVFSLLVLESTFIPVFVIKQLWNILGFFSFEFGIFLLKAIKRHSICSRCQFVFLENKLQKWYCGTSENKYTLPSNFWWIRKKRILFVIFFGNFFLLEIWRSFDLEDPAITSLKQIVMMIMMSAAMMMKYSTSSPISIKWPTIYRCISTRIIYVAILVLLTPCIFDDAWHTLTGARHHSVLADKNKYISDCLPLNSLIANRLNRCKLWSLAELSYCLTCFTLFTFFFTK